MPIYEYVCEANGRVLEVAHKMAERIETWGELCERTGMQLGNTDANAPVTKLMSAGFLNTGGASEAMCDMPACGTGGCGGGGCNFDS